LADAEVWIDSRSVGRTDAAGKLLVTIAPGSHQVRVEAAGSVLLDRIEFFEAGLSGKRIVLPDSPSSGVATSSRSINFLVDANVPGAMVVVDGRNVGVTSDPEAKLVIQLLAGRTYEFRLRKDGFAEHVERVVIDDDGFPSRLRAQLARLAPPPSRDRQSSNGSAPSLIFALVAGLAVFAGGIGFVVVLFRRGLVDGPAETQVDIVERTPALPISFDRYRIGGLLGRGGVATIYRAVDATNGRTVAIKILDPKWMSDPEMVQKFLAEATALEAIHRLDPQAPVVRLFHSGREGGRLDGCPFLAMELLEGETLEQRLERLGAFLEFEAVGIGVQVAQALAVVHRAGVVHRDLTPDNLFLVAGEVRIGGRVLRAAPRVVLIDFGVARQEFLTRATIDGSIAGKPPYMSPEQCRGVRVDSRSDLYTLGILLYVLAAGRPPFESRNPFEVMRAHEQAPPPPLGGSFSSEYRRLVDALLRKDPASRPSSAENVVLDLEVLFDRLVRARPGSA